jgi:endonuclease III
MNKNYFVMKEKIKKINKLLVKHFGIPYRPQRLPNPVDALIATILSQNTNDKNSYQAYRNLKKKYKSVEELADAPRIEIESVIRSCRIRETKVRINKKISHNAKEEEQQTKSELHKKNV